MASEGSQRKARKSRFGWLWNLLGVAILLIGLGVALSPYLDTIAVKTVRCEIESAEPRTASGGSRGSASTAEVLVETSNCGPVVIDQGVSFDNQEEVAASFRVGSEYEFDIGWYSRVIMKNLRGNYPSAQDYRLVQ